MTKEELEKKLKIDEKTCIHCTTLELAKQVLNIFHQLGLRWNNETSYVLDHNWDAFKGNTLYYPFEGGLSALGFANLTGGYKVISAEEFIALHPEGEEFNLENYKPKGELEDFPKEIIVRMLECQLEQWNKIDISVFERDRAVGGVAIGFFWSDTKEGFDFWHNVIQYRNFALFFEWYPKQNYRDNSQDFRVDDLENYIPKGELEGFPKEIIIRMLECQEEQGNLRDISVFEKQCEAGRGYKGFNWAETQENCEFWYEVISNKNFDIFFERYPKQEYQELKNNKKEENSQEFKVRDKVYDILLKEVGVVQDIDYSPNIPYGLSVEFKSGLKSYTINGCYIPEYKNPHLLHYRDDYDYSVIDFNNLPKRQNSKRWRAKKGDIYYSFTSNFKVVNFCDTKRSLDNKAYESGNYFQTKKEAQKVADKLNEYFQNIIKRIGEIYYSFTPNFEVEYFYDDDDIFDKKAYKLGNYFKTKEQAQEVAQKLNTYFKQLIKEEHEHERN